MSSQNLTAEERTERVEKRAQWESFAFAVPCPGKVNVANHSYGEEEAGEHIYTVSVDVGETVSCTCPADEHRPEKCKHRRAVENETAVLQAADSAVTDGGEVIEKTDGREERPDDCECLSTEQGLPCFACWMADFETPTCLVGVGLTGRGEEMLARALGGEVTPADIQAAYGHDGD